MSVCMKHYVCVFVLAQEEQAAKLKAEKIRVALEKIKEAQVKKVCQRSSCLHRFSVNFLHSEQGRGANRN